MKRQARIPKISKIPENPKNIFSENSTKKEIHIDSSNSIRQKCHKASTEFETNGDYLKNCIPTKRWYIAICSMAIQEAANKTENHRTDLVPMKPL